MADLNVIDVIDLDGSDQLQDIEDNDEEDIDNNIEDDTNGALKDDDFNDESLDNHENQESIEDMEDNEENAVIEEEDEIINEEEVNEEEVNEEEINEEEVNEDDVINEEEAIEAIEDEVIEEEGAIEEEEDIIISDDDNSESTANSTSIKLTNHKVTGESLKSFEATPNDSMDSTSIASSQQTSQKSDTKNSTKSKKSEENGDEIEVLSVSESSNATKAQQLLDIAPDISDEETGFPDYMSKAVGIGKRIAINKKTWSNIDVDGNDSILDCPSQVVPLMIQKPNKFPEKLKEPQNETKSETNSSGNSQNSKNMLTIADFYTSSVGKLLVGLGLSRAKQWYHKDAINKVKKQIRREGEVDDLVDELKTQQEYFAECRAANSSYVFPTDKCEHCDFRTEFKLVMEGHMAYPHLTSRREYKCNYCLFMTRDPKQIVLHTQALHQTKCLIEIPPQLYECPVCPYESGVKSKAATHITKCLKFFNAEKLLNLDNTYEFPTITPKPITQEDIKIYEATLQALRFAALNPQTKVPHIPGLPTGLQQQMLYNQQQQLGVRVGPGRPPKQMMQMQHKNRQIAPLTSHPYGKNISPQLYQMLSTAGGHTQLVAIQNKNSAQQMAMTANVMKNSNSNKPNILSKTNNSPINMRPTNDNSAQKSGTFVICEICDGYIKDLEQLRTHMQWIHKVFNFDNQLKRFQ